VTVDNIDIETTLSDLERLLKEDKTISPTLHSTITVLMLVVKLLANKIGLNSHNSSKPPSSDQNRKKDKARNRSEKKSGGQVGHSGTTLEQTQEPDDVKELKIDRRTLPKGNYVDGGIVTRQVFDIDISRYVIEYQAQVLINKETGKKHTASFPKDVTQAVQYGNKIKAHAVYLSQYQLLPYRRVKEYFSDQLGIPISEGSLHNFNKTAYQKLLPFEQIAIEKLVHAPLLHVDETGINMNGSKYWLHCATNTSWTHFFAHQKRGNEATDAAGILPLYKGILCHDHWKPYYRYENSLHSLCNAHHIRELTRAWEQDKQQWANKIEILLKDINNAVHESNGKLEEKQSNEYREEYRRQLKLAEIECPPPDEKERNGKGGRLKRSKSRNLLERLVKYEEDVLRFMDNEIVPFTNNQAERDIRMTKVHQKISGCFRSMEGADMFCRIRGYLSTCRKNEVTSSQALSLLFDGKLPSFCC